MKVWSVVAACVLLAGCSGGAHEAPHVALAAQVTDAATIGQMIGCDTPLKPDPETRALEEYGCEVGDVFVWIIRTPDRASTVGYVKAGSPFGAHYTLVNDHWLVGSRSRALLERLSGEQHWKMF